MNSVDMAAELDPVAPGSEGDLYAHRLPEPAEVSAGPTGLLTLADGPRRLGVLRGVLAGLSFPRIPGTGEDFIKQYGPDADLTVEARTASDLRERIYWIGNALAVSRHGDDRQAIAATLLEAREAFQSAEASAEALRGVHAAWNGAFLAATVPFESSARIARAAAALAIGYAWGAGPISMLAWGALAFLLIGTAARVAFKLRFDREKAYDAKAAIYAERSHGTGMRAVEMYRRGLAH